MKSFRMYPTIKSNELFEEVSRRMCVEMHDFEILERLVGDDYSNDSFKAFDIIDIIGDAMASYDTSKSRKDGKWLVLVNCIADILDELAPGQHVWLLDVSW